MSVSHYSIDQNSTIIDAMKQLTAHNIDILLVTDETQKVLGLLTDGDLRRGLVAGKTQSAPVYEVMSRDFISASGNEDRAFLLDIMIARKIRHLPVLSSDGKLQGIHFLSHIIGHTQRPNIAVIMAGGKGMRLRPITENCPKPMLKVAGRPILERIILHLVSHGITNIYISLNYMGEVIENFFKDGKNHGCSIQYLREKEELGSGGALGLLSDKPEHPFIVMNGDLITDIDIASMLDFHEQSGAAACIATKLSLTKINYGVIEKNGDTLVRISEKPTLQHEINTGTYVFSPECLDLIPKNRNFPITDLFDFLRNQEKTVSVYESQEDWIDVGQPEDLKKAMGYNE